MSPYRAYRVDIDGHIWEPAKLIDSAIDQEAIELARQFVDTQDVELWDGPRFICRISSSKN